MVEVVVTMKGAGVVVVTDGDEAVPIVNAVYSGEVLVINSSVCGITDENCVGGVHENVDLSLVAFLFWF